jgi:hypothetical protein
LRQAVVWVDASVELRRPVQTDIKHILEQSKVCMRTCSWNPMYRSLFWSILRVAPTPTGIIHGHDYVHAHVHALIW